MNFEVVSLTEDKYREWDNFCLASDDAWFWHTTDWLKYILNRGLKAENLSFLFYRDNKLKAIVPLIVESPDGKILEFSFEGSVCPAPALSNSLIDEEKEQFYEAIFAQIDRLAQKNNVARASFALHPLAPNFLSGNNRSNYLISQGYSDISLNTMIIDLSKTEAELWKNLRRNHRRNIKKADNFKINFYTAKNITQNIFNNYKEVHHKAAGRQTRADKTFELMNQWIKNDLAFLAAVELDGKNIGFEYYSVYKNNVNGFSAANDPEYGDLPIRHFLEWQAILWMKKQNFGFYEIGLQQYKILPYNFPDKKQLDISHFKKGFGGFTVPFVMSENFFDEDYFLKVNRERLDKYSNFLA